MNDFEACPTEGALGLLTLLIKSGRFAESRLDQALGSEGLTFVKWRMLDALVNAGSPLAGKAGGASELREIEHHTVDRQAGI